jgi:hypothetical protein
VLIAARSGSGVSVSGDRDDCDDSGDSGDSGDIQTV